MKYLVSCLIVSAPLLAACSSTVDQGAESSAPSAKRGSILSQCGPVDDKQHVNSYDGTLGVSQEYVRTFKGPVGASEFGATAGAPNKWCSGVLIDNDLFLTAGHCWSPSDPTTHVSFNYEQEAGSTGLLEEHHYKIIEAVEHELGGLDYAILRLEGNPGATHGVIKTKITDPAVGDKLAIIGHPNREAKQVEAGTLAGVDGNYFEYGDIDTEGGNSGSGILDADGNVVGVHTNGGCSTSGTGTNSGVRLSRIATVSAVIH